ncbi:hypothetical protein Tcan_11303 [Toxocara canis]|uniref:ZP domain-containing protein n=1 Tax=Toxocara canis TaxID=6265 RepID=A0A0B2W107_TOXCA|nr:hypothetical protein Tcan_11303 [Toxocara canis]
MKTLVDCRLALSICSFPPLVTYLFQFIRTVAADDFQPTVTWYCPSEGFDLVLKTTQPFFGAIHAIDRYQGCRINGTGKTETHYRIPFTSAKECNVKYSQIDDVYSVQIEVNEHPVLILQQDRIFDLICEGKKIIVANNSSQIRLTTRESPNFASLDPRISFKLGVSDADRMLNAVLYGKPYALLVEMKTDYVLSGSMNGAFRVATCRAFGAENTTVELTDSSGCSMDRNLISDFTYGNGRAVAKIPSMFRFPSIDTVRFECSLAVCDDEQQCATSCARRSDAPFDDDGIGEAQLVTELLSKNSLDGVEHGDKRKRLATTVVTVKKGTQSPVSVHKAQDASFLAAPACVSPSDLVLLYKLCVVLCVMFIVGCCINIVFCIYLAGTSPKNRQKLEVTGKTSIPDPVSEPNDFWIKEDSIPSAPMDGQFQNGSANSCAYNNNRRLSLASYASVRQKPHRCFGQLPPQFNGDSSDTPSPKSPTSLRPTTFGSRPYMTNSTTIETDLNSAHSSVVTDRNAGEFSRSDEFPLPPRIENAVFSSMSQNERESYSIL